MINAEKAAIGPVKVRYTPRFFGEQLFLLSNDCSMRSLLGYPCFRILALFLREPSSSFSNSLMALHLLYSTS